MRRMPVVLLLAGLAAGGAGVAWAHPADGDRAARREALQACREQAREADPEAEPGQLREAVRACLEARGITPRPLTPEQREEREERRGRFRECVQQAREENPDAERRELRQAVRECLQTD